MGNDSKTAPFQMRVDKKLLKLLESGSASKGLDKSSYVRMAIVEQLKRDGLWT